MILRLTILTFIVYAQCLYAQSCYYYFNLSSLKFLEDSNSYFNSYLAQNGILSSVLSIPKKSYFGGRIERDSSNKKFILSTLERVSKQGFVSERDRYQTSVELVTALYGSRWFRFFKQSREERLHESIRYQIYQHILDKGFQAFLDQAALNQKLSLWQHTKRVVRIIQRSQFTNWLGITSGILPTFRSANIPEDLILKIVWNGYEAHKHELNSYFPVYNRQDIYNLISPLHTLIYYSFLILYTDHLYVQARAQAEDTQAQQAVEQVEKMGQASLDFVRDYKTTSRENALKEAIRELESELKRPATTEEIEDMRRIIYEE